LKKQSQFAMEDIAASLYAEGGYSDIQAGQDEENKANRSQFDALTPAEGAGKRDKSVTATTG
jgi:hypothetical protein